MAPSELAAMKTNPKFIFFTDFDGTITLDDSNDYMTDNFGFGKAKREENNKLTLDGKLDFRHTFQYMLDSVTLPFDKCKDALIKNVRLDPHFKEFFDWAQQNNVPIVVLSGGMMPIVKGLLEHLVGPEVNDLLIVANDVKAKPGKNINDEDGWDIEYHDDSGFGHDKSLTLKPYADLPENVRPTMFYAGDGVSDLSAAKETDLLFAKTGKDLVTYCVKQEIPFTTFDDWSSISSKVKEIAAGKLSVQDAARQGYETYKKSVAK